jgi:DNA polymerase III subunit chi
MTEIRFYHMERQDLEQVLPSILLKALENGHRVLVKTRDEKEAERLNEHLWVFQPDIFLPHGTRKDGRPEQQPVWLTPEDENPGNADVLILTQGTESASVESYKLCCELLDGRDENEIARGRERWKKYKDSGHALTYWQQGTKSWEKKSV